MSVKKHSSREEDPLEDRLSKHQIRGWRAVSAAGSQASAGTKGVFFHRHRYCSVGPRHK